jgi:hypothetical protein
MSNHKLTNRQTEKEMKRQTEKLNNEKRGIERKKQKIN